LDAVSNRFVAVVLDLPVEILLPEGGSSPQLFWSGWSAVVRVDAVGGPPHGDFTMMSALSGRPSGAQTGWVPLWPVWRRT